MIRKITIYVAVTLIIVSICIPFITTTAIAANPHEGSGFTSTTDACAGCHRTHAEASGAKLIKGTTQLGLCYSCHDGTGASTDVVHGVYLGNSEGVNGAGLKGGGFFTAYMDTDVDGTPESDNITSKHTMGSVNPIAWGSGGLGSNDAGETFLAPLECGNCHNPHGNDAYRILRPQPTGLLGDATLDDVFIDASLESSTNYTIGYDSNFYRDMGGYSSDVLSLMAEWCGQCHERYVAVTGDGSNYRGDTVFMYSHSTDGYSGECLRCHVAHGTIARMTGNSASGSITWPDDASATWQDIGENDHSRLLHIDNRGVCMQCHPASSLTGN